MYSIPGILKFINLHYPKINSQMKKSIGIIVLSILAIPMLSQQIIQVGSGSNNTKGLPYSNEYEYNWCTVIYPQEQINLIGSISEIAYELFNNPFVGPYSDNAASQKVYMAHTSDLYFDVGANYPNPASMTLVYEGNIDWHDHRFSGAEKSVITLDTPFEYNNNDNLIIHIENHSGSKTADADNHFLIWSGTQADYPCLYNQADGAFPASGGTRTKELPIVYLTFEPGLDAGITDIRDDMLSSGTHPVSVRFRNHLTDTIKSVDVEWEINGSPQTTFNWTGSLLSGQETEMFPIGSYDFTAGDYTIKAWTANPNSGTDEDHTNDTLEADIVVVDAVFVDADADGAKNGTSWSDAYDSLHKALEAAASNSIIWVAEGTYLPTNDGDRAKSFELPDSVWLFGGFDGSESELYERNLQDHLTILNGDIGIQGEVSDNSIHVVIAGNHTRLDGFTISGGNADSTCTLCEYGGGILADACKDVRISNCILRDNYASVQGGALCNNFGTGPVYIDSCKFFNNHAAYGGAIDCHDTPSEITRSVFAGNSASIYGGAIFNWGAGSNPVIDHCSFYNNSCPEGSAIHNRAWGIVASITNSIFYGNPDPDIDLSSGAELADTRLSYCLIDQGEFSGNNIITGNPLFADTVGYNLQIMGGSPCIDAGDPESTKDPDGTTADIGAYHFDLDNDAGVAAIFTPADEFQAGIQAISIAVKNFGKTTLTSVTINCEIDGVHHSTQNWNGSLPYAYNSSQIALGSHNFGYGMHTIKVWTSSPNSTTDEQPLNDTLVYRVKSCEYMEGLYDIGPAGDFAGIREAVDSMANMCGISGPVTFLIAPGTYDDQVLIPEIKGLSETSSITFQSLTGDSTGVILTTDSTDYLVFLDGADYVTFKNISFRSEKAAKLVFLDSGACNNVFTGNIFSNPGRVNIYSGTANDSNNLYQYNLFESGQKGLELYGNVSEHESKIRILDNEFSIQGDCVYIQWCDSAVISGNDMQTSIRGIRIVAGYSTTIEKNRIRYTKTNPYEAIYLASCNADTSKSNLIRNNFISGTCGYSGAIRISYSSHQILYHNSVNVTGGYAILVLDHTSNITSKNNIFASDVFVIEWYAANTTDFTSDYNCYYSGADRFVYPGGAGTLEEWQDTSKQDAHSIYFLPLFEGEGDLHTTSYLLDSAGTGLPLVSDDIDGEPRNATHPDIGADEFDSPCTGLLAGNYSIGASGDYDSFTEAYYAVRNCGVDGKVVFTVEDGSYTEQVRIGGYIPGFTEMDSIIFESGGDPESVILRWEADTLSNFTLKLDGAERIVFRNMSIQAMDSTYGTAIVLSGGSHQNRIENCIITGPVADDKDDARSLIFLPGDGQHPDTNNVFSGNTLINGSHGIRLRSIAVADAGKNNVIYGNLFMGQAASGIQSLYQYNLLIEGNIIKNSYQLDIPNYNSYSAIFIEYGTDSAKINGNLVDVDRKYLCQGLKITGYRVLTSNNTVSLRSENYQSTAIRGLGYNHSKCYHNSVNVYGNSQSVALDISYNTSSDVDIKNNIFSNHAKGYAIKYSYGTTVNSDYNSLFTNGEFIGECNNRQTYSDLEAWRSVTGAEGHSVSPAPGHFASDTDLHTSFVLFNGAATPIALVTKDADGADRDPATPDIGAYEFSNASFSMGEDQIACLDEAYVVSAGTGFDSYLWSTGSDSSTTVVDSSGIGRGSVKISVIVGLEGTNYYDTLQVIFTAPIPNPVPEYCFDYEAGGVEITAGEGVDYSWNITGEKTRSIFVQYRTDCTVTVYDEYGCQATGTITIHDNYCYANLYPSKDTSLSLSDSIWVDGVYYCLVDENTYVQYTYTWSTGDTLENFYLRGSDLGTGTHKVWLRVVNESNGCITSDTLAVTVWDNTGYADQAGERLLIYPNPSGDIFYIEGEHIREIFVFNTKGQLIHSDRNRKNIYKVDLGREQKGIYIVKIVGTSNVHVRSVILQ